MAAIKRFFFASVATSCLFLLAFCSGKRTENASGSVTYLSYLDSASGVGPEAAIVDGFEQKYPEVTIARRALTPADVQTRAESYITSSQAPDVMTWIINGEEESLFREGKISDLSRMWKSSEWDEKYPPAVRAASSVNNRFFMLPFGADVWKIFYNKALFSELGLSVPKTWQDFIELCETLKENSITPVTVGARYRWPAVVWFEYINLRLNGSDFHGLLMEGRESFTDGRARRAFKLLMDIINAGYFVENALSLAWAEAIGPLLDGEAAMYLMNTSLLAALPEEWRNNVASFHFPVIDDTIPPTIIGVVEGWIAPSNGRNKPAAELFLSYLGSEAGQTVLSTVADVSVFQHKIVAGGTGSVLTIPEETDTILPSLIRAALPVLQQAFYDSIRNIWLDPSDAAIEQILLDLEKTRGEL